VTYARVLRQPVFRGLLIAEVLSLVADRLAAVALTVLVFQTTGSALLSGATYAATLLPWMFSGLLLGVVADRWSRRTIMVGSDLGRAALVALMTVPGAPTWVLLTLLVLTGVLAPPFEAARAAVLPAVLKGEEYAVGSALGMLVTMLSQLAGLAIAGAVVVQVGVRAALAANAVSFVLSALIVLACLPKGLGDAERAPGPTSYRRDVTEGLSTVFGDARLRSLLVMAWLLACVLVVPEGLAVVIVEDRGASDVWTGVLMASVPAGMAVGAALLGRAVRPVARARALLPLALLATVPLLLTPLGAEPWTIAMLWFLAGVGGAYQMPANVLFMTLVPDTHRGRAFGVAQSGLLALQGVALLLSGAAADLVGPDDAVVGATALALLGVAGLSARWPAPGLERAAADLARSTQDADVAPPPATAATPARTARSSA
jgi:MFS family permease